MSASAYYNEIDPAAAHILRALIAGGVIAPGEVDTRSIKEVSPDDIRGFTQCHFFAGGGLWSVAARLAGWPDDRPLWTGSCPCQPFSVAGKGAGTDDPRHLWPDFHRLIAAARPAVVVGEQVAGKAGYGWLDGVRADLAGCGYACRGVDIPACSVNAPHKRSRLYWAAARDVGHADDAGLERFAWDGDGCGGWPGEAGPVAAPDVGAQSDADNWSDAEWIVSPIDGKARRSKPGIRMLANGIPGRVDLWRVAGNAIVPQVASQVIVALMDTLDGGA